MNTGTNDSHESGEHNQRDVVFPQDINQLRIEFLARTSPRGNEETSEASPAGALEAGGRFDIADDDRDLRLQLSRSDPIRDGFEVGATSGQENPQPPVRRLDFHVR
jgi:hypothetical protein